MDLQVDQHLFMVQIFPQIDTNADGVLGVEELTEWQFQHGHAAGIRRAEREFNHTNDDGDDG